MGIWIINYALAEAATESYLEWFRREHIPEKLARPGYTWAAHYRSVLDAAATAVPVRYTALFGGTDSRVFYNPSPAQIKPTQPPLTREMMAHRRSPEMVIASMEWCQTVGPGLPLATADTLDQSFDQYSCLLWLQFDVAADDQSLSAWCCQQLPEIVAQNAAGITGGLLNDQLLLSKWLAGTGEQRHHLLLHWSPVATSVPAPSPHRQLAALVLAGLEAAGIAAPAIQTGIDVEAAAVTTA